MKSIITVVLLVLSCLLCGCPSIQFINPNAPERLIVNGIYTHKHSGIQFSTQIGSFVREKILVYEQPEKNISVGYNCVTYPSLVALTVYVYPVDTTVSKLKGDITPNELNLLFGTHFNKLKETILAYHRGARLISDDKIFLNQAGRIYEGTKATFEYKQSFSGLMQEVVSSIYLFIYDDYFIKYRVTYPRSMVNKAVPVTEEFIRTFFWSSQDNIQQIAVEIFSKVNET